MSGRVAYQLLEASIKKCLLTSFQCQLNVNIMHIASSAGSQKNRYWRLKHVRFTPLIFSKTDWILRPLRWLKITTSYLLFVLIKSLIKKVIKLQHEGFFFSVLHHECKCIVSTTSIMCLKINRKALSSKAKQKLPFPWLNILFVHLNARTGVVTSNVLQLEPKHVSLLWRLVSRATSLSLFFHYSQKY